MQRTETEILEQLAGQPKDAVGLRVAATLLDEGESTWDGKTGTITRAKGGGSILGAVYVQWPDGHIATRPIQLPQRSA